jgi:ATP-dependent 26S proteasome regulatory subunit
MPKRNLNKLESLITSRHACISILTYEEDYALEFIREAALGQGGKLHIWSASVGMRDGLMRDSHPIADTEHAAAALFKIWAEPGMTGVFVFCDLGGHLKDERTLRMLREVIERLNDRERSTLILIDAADNLPPVIQGTAARMELSFPNEEELLDIVRRTCREVMKDAPLDVKLSKTELEAVVKNLRGLTRRHARQAVLDAIATDKQFDANDLVVVLKYKKELLSRTGLLEFVEAPASMNDVGGLNQLKLWLEKRTESFGEEAAEFGLKPPRGVLLLGVQGAGKSLAAKAVATAWQRPLLRMDVGAFFNKFVGETEKNLREGFRQAEMMAPVVLWIDEIEKAFASASAESADGGLSKRMFGALLTWMQEHKAPVFLIATANDIESLPPELMRKGRFDEIFFVDLPTADARRHIIELHLKKRDRRPADFDLDSIVHASEGFSGAEIEQAIIAGLHTAFSSRKLLSTNHMIQAMKTSPPLSVTMRERVAALRAWAKDRCVPAD